MYFKHHTKNNTLRFSALHRNHPVYSKLRRLDEKTAFKMAWAQKLWAASKKTESKTREYALEAFQGSQGRMVSMHQLVDTLGPEEAATYAQSCKDKGSSWYKWNPMSQAHWYWFCEEVGRSGTTKSFKLKQTEESDPAEAASASGAPALENLNLLALDDASDEGSEAPDKLPKHSKVKDATKAIKGDPKATKNENKQKSREAGKAVKEDSKAKSAKSSKGKAPSTSGSETEQQSDTSDEQESDDGASQSSASTSQDVCMLHRLVNTLECSVLHTSSMDPN